MPIWEYALIRQKRKKIFAEYDCACLRKLRCTPVAHLGLKNAVFMRVFRLCILSLRLLEKCPVYAETRVFRASSRFMTAVQTAVFTVKTAYLQLMFNKLLNEIVERKHKSDTYFQIKLTQNGCFICGSSCLCDSFFYIIDSIQILFFLAFLRAP